MSNLAEMSHGDRTDITIKLGFSSKLDCGFLHNLHFACKHNQAKNTWRNTTVAVSKGLTAPANESKYIYCMYIYITKRKGITMKIKKKGTKGGSRPSAAGRWPGWSPVRLYVSQHGGIHINQLAAVLQLWLCGEIHFVASDVNYVFIKKCGLWHRNDPKHWSSVFFTLQTALWIWITKLKREVDGSLLCRKVGALLGFVLPSGVEEYGIMIVREKYIYIFSELLF